MYYSTTYASPIGSLTLACKDGRLTGLWTEGQKYFGGAVPEKMIEKSDEPVLIAAKKWLDRYFAGKKPPVSELPLAPTGSEFRLSVWRVLCEIPYGEVVTYGAVAKKMSPNTNGRSVPARAVGGAVGRNPISIIIPCHRVIGSDGSLTGYAGGISNKIKLLELEGADMSRLFVPKKGSAI